MIRPRTESTAPAGFPMQVGTTQGASATPQAGTGTASGGEAEPDALGHDESQAKQPSSKEDCEANVVAFETGDAGSAGVLTLQDFGDEEPVESKSDDSGYFDPGVQALQKQAYDKQKANFEQMEEAGETDGLEHKKGAKLDDASILSAIHEADYQMNKALLDMIQRSLDRARKLMEQNAQTYYQKVLPQLQAIEKQLKTAQALEAAGDRQQALAQLKQVDKLTQALQQSLTQSPDFAANPAAKAILAELAVVQQLSSKAQ